MKLIEWETTWSVWSFGWLTFRHMDRIERQFFFGPMRWVFWMGRK